MEVRDPVVINKMVDFLEPRPPHYGLAWYAMYGLAYANVQNTEIHRAIAYKHIYPNEKNSKTRWLQLQALGTLAELKVQDSKIGEWLVYVLKNSTDEEILLKTFEVLFQMQEPPFMWIRGGDYTKEISSTF